MTRLPSVICDHSPPPLIASVPTTQGFRWTVTCRVCVKSWMGGGGHIPKDDLPPEFLRYVIWHLAQRTAAGDAPASVTNLRAAAFGGGDGHVHGPHPYLPATPLCTPLRRDDPSITATEDPVDCAACAELCAGVT